MTSYWKTCTIWWAKVGHDVTRGGSGGEVALTPHMVMEHYLLSCGLRSFTCRWEKIHNKRFKPFAYTSYLKSFIHTIPSKSSKIKIFNCRRKTHLVKHQMCPKYSSFISFSELPHICFPFKTNDFPGRWKWNEPFVALCFSFWKSHITIAPSWSSWVISKGGQTQNHRQEIHSHARRLQNLSA